MVLKVPESPNHPLWRANTESGMDRTAVKQLSVGTADQQGEERGVPCHLTELILVPAIGPGGISQYEYPQGGQRVAVQFTARRFPSSYPCW
jgi:hypothetical protein